VAVQVGDVAAAGRHARLSIWLLAPHLSRFLRGRAVLAVVVVVRPRMTWAVVAAL
jgi:hypothetical protein